MEPKAGHGLQREQSQEQPITCKVLRCNGVSVSRQWWPLFLIFAVQLGSYFMSQLILIDPLFLQKKSVCLYHI